MKAWVRPVIMALITAAFLGLAVGILVLDGPWYLSLAYLMCAMVTGTLAAKTRPHQASPPVRPASPEEQARRARRSGNPAIRAEADRADDPPDAR